MIKRVIKGETWCGESDALTEMERLLTETEIRRNSVAQDELQTALTTMADYLQTSWDTGGGQRLSRFVWSLWNDHHPVSLFDLSSALDHALSEAVITVFRAAVVGALTEEQKREVLQKSGEFARWDIARSQTSEGQEVLYPPPAMSVERLCRLADSARSQSKIQDENPSKSKLKTIRI